MTAFVALRAKCSDKKLQLLCQALVRHSQLTVVMNQRHLELILVATSNPAQSIDFLENHENTFFSNWMAMHNYKPQSVGP